MGFPVALDKFIELKHADGPEKDLEAITGRTVLREERDSRAGTDSHSLGGCLAEPDFRACLTWGEAWLIWLMAEHKKALLAAFAPEFKRAGFKKKSATWHRINRDTIEVFNVQTSQWSEQYYFNAGIYLQALGGKETPPEYECHVRDRIPNLEFHPRSAWDRWIELSDFEIGDLNPALRIQQLKELIEPLALEWLSRFRELEDIPRTLAAGPSPDIIKDAVWPLVGLEPPRFVKGEGLAVAPWPGAGG